MNLIIKRPLVCTMMLLAAIASSRAQVTAYDNLGTTSLAGYSEANGNAPTFGDSLNLSQAGTLTTFGTALYNSSSGGNTGAILTGTMAVKFYDNTIPYSGGAISGTLLGSATLSWDFTGGGGLPAGFFSTATFDLSGLGIVLPQNILVTQKFTQTSGTSTRNGQILFSAPVVGSSPNTVYIKSSATAEGLYTFTGNPGQFGYTIVVNAGGGNQPPIATPQSVSLQVNTTANITLAATDAENDPLTYSVVNNPTNGILTGTAPNLVYQPNLDYTGPDAFTFIANDGTSDSAPALVSITVNSPSAGLIINPVWDSTITSDPNAAAIMNTISNAILVFQSKFSDPVTVQITFAEMGSGLGQSSTFIGTVPYSSFYPALVADSKTTNDVTALAHVAGGSTEPVNGGSNIKASLPNLRALGFAASPPGGQSDSTISLNMSLINITRTSINPSKYDLQAVVSHEIDEVLGTISGVGGTLIFPADLYRYTAAGARTWTTSGDDAFFSINTTTDLARYNQDSGGDYGDWWSIGAHTPKVQDAFGTPAATPNLGVELTVLDVVGWDLVTVPAAGAPVFRPVTRTNNTINLAWSSVAGRTYQVQYKTNLNAASWNNLSNSITASSSITTASDSIGTNKQRFYRVALLPTPGASLAGSQPQKFTGPIAVRTSYYRPELRSDDSSALNANNQAGAALPAARLEPIEGRFQQK